MKVKLKDGNELSGFPRANSTLKRISNQLANSGFAIVDSIPDKVKDLLEEIDSKPAQPKKEVNLKSKKEKE
jgi:hypothetical protein